MEKNVHLLNMMFQTFFPIIGKCVRQIIKKAMFSLIQNKIGTSPSF